MRSSVARVLVILPFVALPLAASVVLIGRFAERSARTRAASVWVKNAEAAAIGFLSDPGNLHPYPLSPRGGPPDLGKFVSLSGDGYDEAVWNIQRYDYVRAIRVASFRSGDLPVTMYVRDPGAGDLSRMTPYVQLDEWGTGIAEGDFGQQLSIHIAWR